MTNQQINQLYWELPDFLRALLDSAIDVGLVNDAAPAIRFMVENYLGHTLRKEECLEWAKWRESIANSTRKD